MTPENIQQGHLWKDFANGLTEPTNSICRLALNGIQYILLGINAWVQPFLYAVVSGVTQQVDMPRQTVHLSWRTLPALSTHALLHE